MRSRYRGDRHLQIGLAKDENELKEVEVVRTVAQLWRDGTLRGAMSLPGTGP